MTYINSSNFIKAVKFIYQNLDEPISLELIAKNIGVSISTLKKLFLDASGSSVGSFIRRLRMERAFRSLKNKEESILEIALPDHHNALKLLQPKFGRSYLSPVD